MRGTIDHIEDKGKYIFLIIDNEKYSWWDADKDISQGQQVEFEWKKSKTGDFKNITELKVVANSGYLPQQRSQYNDSKTWNTCLMSAKDLMVALLTRAEPGGLFNLEEIKKYTVDIALSLYQASEGGEESEEPEPPKLEEDDIPF